MPASENPVSAKFGERPFHDVGCRGKEGGRQPGPGRAPARPLWIYGRWAASRGPLELAVVVVRLLQAAQPVPALPVLVGDPGHQQLALVRVEDDVVVVALAYGEVL